MYANRAAATTSRTRDHGNQKPRVPKLNLQSQHSQRHVEQLHSVCTFTFYPPVEVVVVILSFTPEVKEHEAQEEGEDEEAKAATLQLEDIHNRDVMPRL